MCPHLIDCVTARPPASLYLLRHLLEETRLEIPQRTSPIPEFRHRFQEGYFVH